MTDGATTLTFAGVGAATTVQVQGFASGELVAAQDPAPLTDGVPSCARGGSGQRDDVPRRRRETPPTGLTAAEVAERVAAGRTNATSRAHQPHGRRDRPGQRLHRFNGMLGRAVRARADVGPLAERPVRRWSSSPTRPSASCRRCGPSGRSTGWRCSTRPGRAWCATAPSSRSRSPRSCSTTCSSCAPGDQVPADGVVRDGDRARGRRVAAHRRGRPRRQGSPATRCCRAHRRGRARPVPGDGASGPTPTPPGWRPRPGGSPRPAPSWWPASTGCCAGSRWTHRSSSARSLLWSQFRTEDNDRAGATR